MTPTLLPRTGSGFDVHRFGESGSAESVMLCGVAIAHDRALSAIATLMLGCTRLPCAFGRAG